MNYKLTVASILIGSTIFTSQLPVNAANTSIDITGEATLLNVTVPTNLPIVLNADGTNTLPTDFKIINNSPIGAVKISKVDLKANKNWKIVNGNITNSNANTKQLKFYIKEPDQESKPLASDGTNGSLEMNTVVEATDNEILEFNIERGAFTSSLNDLGAFDMELTIGWNS